MRHGQIWETLYQAVRTAQCKGPGLGAICSPVLYCVGKRSRKESRTSLQMSLSGSARGMREALGLVLSTRKEGVALLVPMSTGYVQTVCIETGSLIELEAELACQRAPRTPVSTLQYRSYKHSLTCWAFYKDARHFRLGSSCFHSESS